MCQRNLGDLGEATLRAWAAQIGIVINQSQQDRTGWDFLLEFPEATPPTIQLPLDQSTPPLMCFVQVKATDQQRGRQSISLSNWKRHIENPLPVFFLVLEFDGLNTCQRAFLVHVGEELMRRGLYRLRTIGPDEQHRLHRRTMSFTYQPVNTLPSCDGRGLVQAIQSHIDGSLFTYTTHKVELYRLIGDEGGHLTVQMAIPPDQDPRTYLIDFLIGIHPHVEVIEGTLTPVRFGIPAPTQIGRGRLQIEPQPRGPGALRFALQGEINEVTIPTTVYTPPDVVLRANEQFHRAHFEAPFLQCVVQEEPPMIQLRPQLPNQHEPQLLSDLYPVATLIQLLQRCQQAHRELTLTCLFRAQPFCEGTLRLTSPLNHIVLEAGTVIRYAWEIAQALPINHPVEVTLAELRYQKIPLQLVHAAHRREAQDIQMEWISAELAELDGCIPLVMRLVMRSHRIIAAVLLFGRPEPTGPASENEIHYRMDVQAIQLHRWYYRNREEPFNYQDIKQTLTQEMTAEYEDTHQVILLDNE